MMFLEKCMMEACKMSLPHSLSLAQAKQFLCPRRTKCYCFIPLVSPSHRSNHADHSKAAEWSRQEFQKCCSPL